jgi:hypothetical protein
VAGAKAEVLTSIRVQTSLFVVIRNTSNSFEKRIDPIAGPSVGISCQQL